jgi:hypothetical protein
MALLLVACGDKPPFPKIKVGDQKVLVEPGTYSWRFLAKHVIADSPGPSDIVDPEHDAITVAPGSELSITFSSKPKTMVLSTWEGNQELSTVELQSGKYKLPSDKGTYIYSVRANWSKGSGMYAFVLKVE